MPIKNTLNDVEMPGYLEESGKGLSVLICADYRHISNWMAYSAWYSVKTHFPEAKIAITVPRSTNINQFYYGWVYKCDVCYHLHKNVGELNKIPYLNKIYGVYLAIKNGLVKQPLLVLEADMMAIDSFLPQTIELLNKVDFATNPSIEGRKVGSIWYFNKQPLEKIANIINKLKFMTGDHIDLEALSQTFDNVTVVEDLGNEVSEERLAAFTHYRDSCGNFTKKNWSKGKIIPPFNVAYALHTNGMTVSEKKVINLWSQMGSFYEVASQVKQ